MKYLFWCCPFFLLPFVHIIRAATDERAIIPPRGWNSRDAYSWKVDEELFLTNAKFVASKLKEHGYERVETRSLITSGGFDLIDQWGRPVPDHPRWPSSRDGSGLGHVAKKVHDLGLKFGIHVMRGLSMVAYEANNPILDINTGRAYQEGGRTWTAKDIGVKDRACPWMEQCFMSVNTDLGAGKAFLRSLYHQYNQWGVDFVKHDCVFGDDLDIKEIRTVSQILRKLNRPILYSISPGRRVTPQMAGQLAGLVNMYRITVDAGDTWPDIAIHFDAARDFAAANLIAGSGLHGRSWPDFDILPLGTIAYPDPDYNDQRECRLTPDEQRTMMTLWAMAKSPLMFGGDMRIYNDEFTINLITNPTVLEINSISTNNREVYHTDAKISPRNSETGFIKHQRGNLIDANASHSYALGLASCKDEQIYDWSVEALDQDVEQVCWRKTLQENSHAPFCLQRRKSLLKNEDTKDKHHYLMKPRLSATNKTKFCLDGSPKQRLTAKEAKTASFSPCKWDANQLWELQNGTLVNAYSGLCATGNVVKAFVSDIRVWIAVGPIEIYVAIFNLTPEGVHANGNLPAILREARGVEPTEASCKVREVWSDKDFGIVTDKFYVTVPTHGTALFVLNCDDV